MKKSKSWPFSSVDVTIFALLIIFIFLGVRVIHVQGESMEPTFSNDDITIGIGARNIQRNDIVVAKHQSLGYIIKRVVGLEGDHVLILENGTYVNDELLDTRGSNVTVDVIVPENSVFLVGDNRGNSTDSRAFGAVDISQVSSKLLTTKSITTKQYHAICVAIIFLLISYGIRVLKSQSKEVNKWEEQEEAQQGTDVHQEEVVLSVDRQEGTE